MEDKTMVHVRIDDKVLDFVKQQANKDGRTLSGMIIIYFGLANEKEKQNIIRNLTFKSQAVGK